MSPIVKKGGEIVGYTRTIGDRIELIKPGGKLIGIFLIKQNQTILPGSGGLVGYGNLLMTLLED